MIRLHLVAAPAAIVPGMANLLLAKGTPRQKAFGTIIGAIIPGAFAFAPGRFISDLLGYRGSSSGVARSATS